MQNKPFGLSSNVPTPTSYSVKIDVCQHFAQKLAWTNIGGIYIGLEGPHTGGGEVQKDEMINSEFRFRGHDGQFLSGVTEWECLQCGYKNKIETIVDTPA